MHVWTFWEPKNNIPYYLQLCLKTWEKYLPSGYDIHVLDYESIREYIDIDFYGANLFSGKYSLPKVADALRALLLYEYGGLWMDLDTIMLNDSVSEYFHVDEDKLVFFGDTKRNVHLAIIYAPPKTDCMKGWMEYCKKIISSGQPSGSWSEMGNDFIDPYVKSHMEEIKVYSALEHKPEFCCKAAELDNEEAYEDFYFCKSKHLNEISTNMLILHNSWSPNSFKMMSEKEFLRSDCTMANVLREALQIKAASERISFQYYNKKNVNSFYDQDVIFLGRKNSALYDGRFQLLEYKNNVVIQKRNHGFNFYRYNIPQGKKRYVVSLTNVQGDFPEYTVGLYDFCNKREIKYDICKIGEPVYFDFVIGEHMKNVALCVYAGLQGHTYNKELKIGEMSVMMCPLLPELAISKDSYNQEIVFLGDKIGFNSRGNVVSDIRTNILLPAKNSNFNFYRYNIPKGLKEFYIKISGVSAKFDEYTAGIFDFKNSKILHYETCKVSGEHVFHFLVGKSIDNIALCIYAGITRHTAGNEMRIKELAIMYRNYPG